VDTTEAKISSDMPLPTPRWLISSPIHMSSAVPAVSDRITSATRLNVKSGMTMTPAVLPKAVPWPRPKMNVMPVACTKAMPSVR